MHNVFGSTSTKTGIPPLRIIACAVEINEREGKITSLFFMSKTDYAKFRAAVPLFTATLFFVLVYLENIVSNFCTF